MTDNTPAHLRHCKDFSEVKITTLKPRYPGLVGCIRSSILYDWVCRTWYLVQRKIKIALISLGGMVLFLGKERQLCLNWFASKGTNLLQLLNKQNYSSLWKQAYSDILKILPPTLRINIDIFHISAQNINCAYSLELPRRGGSNKYPQSMFLSRN